MVGSDVAAAAQLACLLEASAPKPGNVCPGRHFADIRYEDFLASAAAIGGPLAGAGHRPLGATIRLAIEATARWVPSNTNLGIVLLLAPLARAVLAAADPEGVPLWGRPPAWGDSGLRDQLRKTLAETTVEDAREAYAAIRLASPGGLGRAGAQDVADEPTVTLLDAMRLAADRDGIAREYVTGFDVTFTLAAPALRQARGDGLAWDDAVVETFLTVLAANRDSHIERRAGVARADEVSQYARAAMAAGGVRASAGCQAITAMDRALRDERNSGNPGTTADLTAAAAFVVLLDGGWTATQGGRHAATR